MAFRKVLVPSPEDLKTMVDAYDIPIMGSNELWSQLQLADGTVFKVKLNVISVARVIGKKDPSGNPIYLINGQPAVALIELGANAGKDEIE